MFRRLKEKISEEVSKSPLRLQSSVQSLGQQLSPFKEGEAKNDNSSDISKDSSTSNSNVQNLIDLQENDSSILDASENQQFSITDEDGAISAPTSPTPKSTEFTNVDLSENPASLLKVSVDHQENVASAKSPSLSHVLFPIYNPSTPVYHIQSDLESASEFEDSSPQLDSLSKEKIFQGFQAAKSRYLSYKSRYFNAVKAYKEQVEEISRIKVVLSETQDRAFRRIAEMKEQSQLDQKAKAHLEDSLRITLEEKDQLISVLHTQIRLLKNGEEVQETENEQPLIDIDQTNGSDNHSDSEENLRLKVKNYEETVSRLKGFLKNCKETITKNREITTRLNAEKEDIKKQFENAIVRLSELEKKSSLKDAELQKVKADTVEEINRLKKSDEERGLQVAEYKRTMHDEMNTKEKEIEGLTIQLKEIVSHNEELRKTIDAKAKQIADLENSNAAAINMQQSFVELEKNSEEEKQSLLQEMSRSKSAAIELIQQEFQRTIKDLKSENEDVINKLEMEWQGKFRSKIEELELQIAHEVTLKANLEEELEKLKLNGEEMGGLNEQLTLLEAQILELKQSEEELIKLKVDHLELQTMISDEQKVKQEAIAIKEEVENNLKDSLNGIEELKSKYDKLEASNLELQTLYSNEQKLKQMLSEDLDKLKEDENRREEEERVRFEQLKETNNLDAEWQQIRDQLEQERLRVKKLKEKKLRTKSFHDKELSDVRQQLTLELDNSRNICHNLKAEIDSTKVQLDSLTLNHAEQINNFKIDIDAKQSDIDAKQIDIDAKQIDIEGLKSQLESNEKLLKTNVLELEDLKTKLTAVMEEKEQLGFKFEELLQSSEEIEVKMKEDHNRQLVELKSKTEETLKVLREQYAELEKQLEKERTSFEQISNNSNEEIRKLENSLSSEKSINEDLAAKLKEIEAGLNLVEDQRSDETKRLIEEIQLLKTKLTESETSATQCQKEFSDAKVANHQLEIKLVQMEQELEISKVQLLGLSQEKGALESVSNCILEALNCEDQDERSVNIESLESNPLSQKLKETFINFKSRCSTLEEELKKVEDGYQSILSESANLKEQIFQFETQKDGFIKEIQSLQDELRKMREESVESKINIDVLKSEITVRQQEIRSLQDQNCNIGELELRIKDDEGTIEKLNEDLDKRRLECEAHNLELEKYQSARVNFQGEIDNLKSENNLLSAQISEQKADFDKQLKVAVENCEQVWQVKLDRVSEEHQVKLKDLKKRAENKLGQIKNQMSNDSEKLKEELLNRIQDLEVQKQAIENQCRESLLSSEKDKEAVSELNRQLDSTRAKHEIELKTFSVDMEEKRLVLLREKEKLIAEIEVKNSQLDESLITSQINCTKTESEMNALRADFDEAKKFWEDRDTELRDQLKIFREKEFGAVQIETVLKDHQDEIEKLKVDHQSILRAKEEEFKAKIKEVTEEFSKLQLLREEEDRQTVSETIERSMVDDNRLRKKYEQQINEFQQELVERDKSIEQLIEEKQNMIQEKKNELSDVSSRYEEGLKVLRFEHQQQLDVLDKKYKASMKREIDFQSRSHEEEIRGLSDEWDHDRKLFSDDDLNSMAKIEIVQEELQRQADLATSALESGVQSSELLQRQIRVLQNQIETIKEQHKSEVNELRQVLNMSNHSVPPNLYQKAQLRDHNLETLEIEYLRNILYEYMMGKETLVLAKVIATVLKFDKTQMQKILEKEELRTGGAAGPFGQLLK